MKIKKYILSLLIGATALSFSACNDFLDRDPLGQFTEDDAPNALVGGKMYNVYYLMRGYDITAGIPAFMIHMVRSEDSEKGSDAGDGGEQSSAVVRSLSICSYIFSAVVLGTLASEASTTLMVTKGTSPKARTKLK